MPEVPQGLLDDIVVLAKARPGRPLWEAILDTIGEKARAHAILLPIPSLLRGVDRMGHEGPSWPRPSGPQS